MVDYENTGSAVEEEDDSDNYYEEVSLHEYIGDARYVSDTSRKPFGQNKPNNENPNVNWKERQKKGEIENKSNVKERLHERQTDENLIITSQRKNKSTKWKILFGISLIICTGLASGHLYVIVKELSATVCTREHCLNGGQCFISEDDYRCACPRGFYGPRCESTSCSDQPCLNNGTCTVLQHTFNCSCLEGFGGTQCEDTPCTRGHCFNGGQCFISEDDYRCACPRGFYGPQCESTPCSDQPCLNNGACTVWQHTFNCSCLEGFDGTLCEDMMKDCSGIKEKKNTDGVYDIYPTGKPGYKVYCDMTTDGGGWTVFQRRINGQVSFYDKTWVDYANGFGQVYQEYWLGNEKLHQLTNNGTYVLRINIMDWSGQSKYAVYDNFKVENGNAGYKLHLGRYHGTAGDSMKTNNKMRFTTIDKNNDGRGKEISCANVNHYRGAWWYPANCGYSNLNGEYVHTGTGLAAGRGIHWEGFRGFSYSLKQTQMMIRRQ